MSHNLIFHDHVCLVAGLISSATETEIAPDELLELCGSREEIVAHLILNKIFGQLSETARNILKKGAMITPNSVRPAATDSHRDSGELLAEEERAGRVLLRILETQEEMRPTFCEYEMIRRNLSLVQGSAGRDVSTIFDGIL